MSVDVARGHDDDGGGDDRPPSHQIGGGCRDQFGPQAIRFEWNDRGTLMPLGDHVAHWANLLGEIVREFPMHFRSWHNISEERKAGVLRKIGKDIELHLAKIYTDNKSSLKVGHWVANPDDGTYDNVVRCAQNAQNRAKSMVICRQGSRSLAVLKDRQDEERLLYEMLRLQGLGTYTDDHIMAIVRRGKQRGHIPGLGRVLARRGRDVLVSPEPRCTYTADVDELKRTNRKLKKQMDMIMKVVRRDDKMSQLLTELQSQYDVGSGSGSGGGGDDEPGDDEDAEEEDEDS
ncbi:hypothetical protein Tco_0704760 [Tanacetum coccineum]|uniref:Uncharacterized protein n=1 Tax=Tanacetum coccineum TaxID=301880 RepID=A0ABQ4Y2L2_9ASTR